MTTEYVRKAFARIRREPGIGVVEVYDVSTGEPRYLLAAVTEVDGDVRIDPLGEVWDEGRIADVFAGLQPHVEGLKPGVSVWLPGTGGSQASGTDE